VSEPSVDGRTPAQVHADRGLLLAVCLATSLVPLNSTMVAVALPDVARDLGVQPGSGLLLVSAYLVVTAALQPVAGSLGDRWGRRGLILGGVTVFGLSSVAAAVSPDLPVLVVLRCLQAAGGALALPNAAALVREALPPELRGRAFGTVGAAATVAAAAGPPVGGVLTASFGWRAVFLVNVPLALTAVWAGRRSLPPAVPRGGGSFDVVGALLLLAGLGGLSALLTTRPGGSTAVLGIGAVALAWAAFVPHELRCRRPVLDPRLFRSRGVAAGSVAVAASNLALYVLLLAVPVLLSGRYGEATLGLLLIPLPGATSLLSPIGGRLSDRLGRRTPAVLGLGLLTAALLPLVVLGRLPSVPVLLVVLGLAGAGLGLAQAPVQAAAVEAVAPERAGMAAGAWSSSRYLGSIIGSAVLAALLHGQPSGDTVRPVLILAAAGAVLSLGAALALPKHPPTP
jgi:DHA2 family methylenomycin A resistance protein-like MFS transporter